jgi:cyclic pyranopterin phosphate synthase
MRKSTAGPGRESFSILSINVSEQTGVPKHPVPQAVLRKGRGIEGDAHAGPGHRQVSLLADEDIETMRSRLNAARSGGPDAARSGRGVELPFGAFAENLTTRGIDLAALPLGSLLHVGPAVLEVTQIGKECHADCAIRRTVGDCVMPRRGVFTRVLRGGRIDRESRCYHYL